MSELFLIIDMVILAFTIGFIMIKLILIKDDTDNTNKEYKNKVSALLYLSTICFGLSVIALNSYLA